jgi:cytochrome c553
LKTLSLLQPATAVAILTAVVFAIATVAQAPQTAASQQPAAGSPPPQVHEHAHPAPTNLKVLPKNLTGEQVHEIMEKWEDALAVHCSACHAADPNNIGPNGRPRLNFADDSKPEKATARKMYTMTEEINMDYISKIDSSGAPVTCGTCHRGHFGPQPFVAPLEDRDRSHPPQSEAPPLDSGIHHEPE